MRKLAPFKPSLVTREFFPGFLDPSVINEGQCFMWAYFAHLVFRDVELWDMNCHAFVRYRGRFYDSERLKGVVDWQDLPATEHGESVAARRPVLAYKKYWKTQPERFNSSWQEMETQARRLLLNAH